MFCPTCKAEFRAGFYRCSDCDCPLVETLSPESALSQERARQEGEEAAVLCQEDDPAILTAILTSLSDAHIPYYDHPIQDAKAHLSAPFPGGLSLARGYEIHVLKSDLPAAQRILGTILDREDELPPTTLAEDFASGREQTQERQLPENWDPTAATTEIWSGEDEGMAQFLADTLRENGILSQTLSQPGARLCLLTTAEDALRGRMIVREVIEGTAPA